MSGSLASLASPSPARPPRYLPYLAGGLPLAYYVATAASQPGFYEEGTFVAAARSLGIAHPPGAPITSLLFGFVALLPVGSLSFRVSVASAVFAAVILATFARALFFSLLGVGVRSSRHAALLSLAAAWFVGQTPLFFTQATRPNVFTVQFALSMIVVDALSRFELSEPTDDRRTLYFAAFVQGLSFANHHVFGLLMLSVAAPTLGRVFARRGFLGLMGHVAAPILGFSAYAYVPIRGGRFPYISIGDPSSLTRALWVLSADPWWGPPDAPEPATLARLYDGLSGGHASIAVALFLLAVVGFAVSARAASPRRFAALWLIMLLVPLSSVALILRPKLNDDAWGALIPCALALVALATCGIGLALRRIGRRLERPVTRGLFALAGAALALLVLTAGQRGRTRSISEAVVDDLARRNLPTRAVIVTRDAGTWFRSFGSETEEQLRLDLTLVALPFLAYPRHLSLLVASHPELDPLLATLDDGSPVPPNDALRALSLKRPVLLELDHTFPPSLYPALSSEGLYERVWPTPPIVHRQLMHAQEDVRFTQLYARLDGLFRAPPLARHLARTHFYKGVVAGTLGDRGRASMHARLGLHDAPDDALLTALLGATRSERAFDPVPLLQLAAEAHAPVQ